MCAILEISNERKSVEKVAKRERERLKAHSVEEARLVSSCLSCPSSASPHLSLLLASSGRTITTLLRVKPGPTGHPSLRHPPRLSQKGPRTHPEHEPRPRSHVDQRSQGERSRKWRTHPISQTSQLRSSINQTDDTTPTDQTTNGWSTLKKYALLFSRGN